MALEVPLLIRGAFLWNKHSIRAKSAVPRLIGRYFARKRTVFIDTASGAKLNVDLTNLDTYAWIYNLGGMWDPPVMRACQMLLRDGDVFYDIGSNTGIFAIDAAFRSNITAFAFEPQSDQAEAIEKSIKANGMTNALCIRCMLGEKDGVGELYLTSHSIHASSIPREKKFKRVEIPMRSIDSMSREKLISDPDIVKIDVEGGELAVLRGAHETFVRSIPSIVFEADENLRRFGTDPDELVKTISSFGEYRFFQIGSSGMLSPIEKIKSEGNFLALSARHNGRMD
jgi:FkbM family methyltransferase